MKWILFVLVFCSLNAYSQEDTSRYQRYATTYGMQVPRMWASKVFRLPDTSRVNSLGGALGTNPAKSELWLWNGENWSLIRGGGGSGTSYTGGLWTNITGSQIKSDSAAMAAYFLRRKDSGVNYVTPFQLGGYIPLSGTVAGKPVTNSIETNSETAIRSSSLMIIGTGNDKDLNNGSTRAGVVSFISNENTSVTTLAANNSEYDLYAGLSVEVKVADSSSLIKVGGGSNFMGINGMANFSRFYGDLSYVQKIYSDKNLDTIYRSGDSLIVFKKNGTRWGIYSPTSTGGGGTGTVSTLSVTTANGISGTVANASTTPAITLNLDATRWQTKAATKTTSDSVVALIPTNNNTLTNGAGYITNSGLSPYKTIASSNTDTTTLGGELRTKINATNTAVATEGTIRAAGDAAKLNIADTTVFARKATTISFNGGTPQDLSTNRSFTVTAASDAGKLNISDTAAMKATQTLLYVTQKGNTTDSIKFNPALRAGVGGADSLTTNGDSFTFGLLATATDSNYASRLAKDYSLVLKNRGVSSTVVWDAVKNHLASTNYPHNGLSSLMSGFNDIQATNISLAANRPTINKIIQAYKAFWLNHYATAAISPSSGTGVTRSGTWSTNWNATIEGGKSTTAAYTSVNAAYIEYVFTDSTIAVELMGQQSSGGGTFTIAIDGSTIYTGTLASLSDGGGGHTYTPTAFIFSGLSYASHTMRVTKTGGNLMVVDYFTTLQPSSFSVPVLFWHVPKRTTTGLAAGFGTTTNTDLINSKLDSVTSALQAFGRPIYIAKSNDYYNLTTGVASDSIHPNNTGHVQLENAGINALSGANSRAGSLDYRTDGFFYGSKNGVSKKIAYDNEVTLQKVISNGANLSAPNTISGSNNSFSLSSFSNIGLNAFLNVTSTSAYASGVLGVTGAASTLSIGARDGTLPTHAFHLYATVRALRIYDYYNGRDAIVIDTSLRTYFKNAQVSSANRNPLAAVDIGGNYYGVAGHAPLMIGHGPLMTLPEPSKVENDSLHLYFTQASATTPIRFQIPNSLSGTATIDFASTTAQTSSELTFTVAGVVAGDFVLLTPADGSSVANSTVVGRGSAANTVTARFNNYSSSAIDPASTSYNYRVLK